MQSVTGVTVGFRAKAGYIRDDVEPFEQTWSVTAFCPATPLVDIHDLRIGLRQALEDLPGDDAILPDDLWTAEAIGEAVMKRLDGCSGVRVAQAGHEAWIWR